MSFIVSGVDDWGSFIVSGEDDWVSLIYSCLLAASSPQCGNLSHSDTHPRRRRRRVMTHHDEMSFPQSTYIEFRRAASRKLI